MVTIGLFLATAGEAEYALTADSQFLVGISLLTFVLFLQAWLGHLQHGFYERFAKNGADRGVLAEEFLFYSHAASLLPMIAMQGHIAEHVTILADTAPLGILPGVPAGYVWLVLNVACQAICIKGVFYLSANYGPLAVNLTLSIRKFSSVLFSVFWFGNPWNIKHAVATGLIFAGVFLYFNGPKPAAKEEDDKKKK